MSKIPHGTAGGYSNHRCRCPRCRKAWAIYHHERGYGRKPCPQCGSAMSYVSQLCRSCELAQRPKAQHGTETYYTNHKCRCDACRTAANEARTKRRHGVAAGTHSVLTHNRGGYASGCRCDICTQANTDYSWRRGPSRRLANV